MAFSIQYEAKDLSYLYPEFVEQLKVPLIWFSSSQTVFPYLGPNEDDQAGILSPTDEDKQQITIEEKKQSCVDGCDEVAGGEGAGKVIPPGMVDGLVEPDSDDASIQWDEGDEDWNDDSNEN